MGRGEEVITGALAAAVLALNDGLAQTGGGSIAEELKKNKAVNEAREAEADLLRRRDF